MAPGPICLLWKDKLTWSGMTYIEAVVYKLHFLSMFLCRPNLLVAVMN